MYKAVRARMGALMCGVMCRARSVFSVRSMRRDAGMVTSEYAMGIVAAVAFAVVLYKVVTSGTVSAELQAIVKQALDAKA
ncbi:DUF4244 domain-containing protein [Streptomyces griseorubiginosus]|uniref:DUF4244 domain-containing protein n=1 Tax=Streptomyces griseorubiginosus TaxID=67304 RepID=UPI002E803382|nr:DUF4244 domain-containing protein [Streptomyces griseorubiginosus]WUB45290.1 DUF4244 domain-containing protein [Streptomyces griseorubiginosus]WUB53807.1 DUF4244 domain-containing protein [Streptomyces griseorubiginosus]